MERQKGYSPLSCACVTHPFPTAMHANITGLQPVGLALAARVWCGDYGEVTAAECGSILHALPEIRAEI